MPFLFDIILCGCSSKREPLGKGYVRGHKIPDGLGTQTPFGAAIHAKVSCTTSAKDFALFMFYSQCPLNRSPLHHASSMLSIYLSLGKLLASMFQCLQNALMFRYFAGAG